jgi:tetratricopeptide (TPR) repeat protein
MLTNNTTVKNQRNKYELACKFEKAGIYKVAFAMFRECLAESSIESGELLFKCGWCIENIDEFDNSRAIEYYIAAGENTSDPVSRMNSFFRAGWLFMHLNKNREAINVYSKSIQTGHAEGIFNSIYSEAMYWCAVCLERENQFIDAIELYRTVSLLYNTLRPESLFREICCNISIGHYTKAHQLCKKFGIKSPDNFSTTRYSELLKQISLEQANLETICHL